MNKDNKSIKDLFLRIWFHFSSGRKYQFILISCLMILSSISELISLGSIIPFLSVLIDPSIINKYPLAINLMSILNIKSHYDFIFFLSFVFILITLINTLFRLFILWCSNKFSFAIGADFGVDIFRKTLSQPYDQHISVNSANLINGILNKANAVVYNTISPILNILSASIIFIIFIVTLFVVNYLVAFSIIIIFGLFYFLIILSTKKILFHDGQKIANESTNLLKNVNESFGGIRDIIIDQSQSFFINIFRESDLNLKKAQLRNVFINSSPRFIVEAMAIIIIASIALALSSKENGVINSIPFLGALVMGGQRILPLIQQAFSSWALLQGGKQTLFDVLDLLDKPQSIKLDYSKKLNFSNSIKMSNISFKYSEKAPFVIRNLNIEILKGQRIGLVGKTASGKSTFLDLLVGLLVPHNGKITLDNVEINSLNMHLWQKKIAHVPQHIFLADKSLLENIAFGIDKDDIDEKNVIQALKKAKLYSSVIKMPDGIYTNIGERGVRLSGGQRQRVGIARALYKKASLIIFDEATSALDIGTEAEIMDTINSLSKDITMLIIAHRTSILKKCDHIYQLHNGKLRGPYDYSKI